MSLSLTLTVLPRFLNATFSLLIKHILLKIQFKF